MKRLLLLLFLFPICAFAKEKPIIVLDAGHGGKDMGAKVRNFEEKKLTLRTTFLVKKHLEELGYRVILTRARDVFLPLGTRVALANQRPSSLFVSIHYNSALSPAASGIEVYYYSKAEAKRRASSKELATHVLKGIIKEAKPHSRGVKQGNFQVIRETTMPAILIEAGFITNNEERALLGSQTYLDQLSKGIALGVDQFVRLKR
jgi:N-acetylmuramoyl-L-alanine amidase